MYKKTFFTKYFLLKHDKFYFKKLIGNEKYYKNIETAINKISPIKNGP
ncbi:hypothetical protein DFR78_1231 [Halanaerobium sp. MA284_MarDTE_T2]|nr:hypothetical protein DFR78_1231 [Halanaerobium sp. MA284_MarDTE_T2]RCW77770.1 hypothetical protein DER71_1762 [Halanaerobium sp. DL-01]